MAEKGPFVREIMPCPKCGKIDVVVQELRQIYKPQKAWHQPLYNASVTPRIICADPECGAIIWQQDKKKAPDSTIKEEQGK
jgi:hypothetical protein